MPILDHVFSNLTFLLSVYQSPKRGIIPPFSASCPHGQRHFPCAWFCDPAPALSRRRPRGRRRGNALYAPETDRRGPFFRASSSIPYFRETCQQKNPADFTNDARIFTLLTTSPAHRPECVYASHFHLPIDQPRQWTNGERQWVRLAKFKNQKILIALT